MEKRKLKKSKLNIILYVISALILVYGVYTITTVVEYLNVSAQSYDITGFEAFNYILSSVINYFVYALLIYVAAVIHNGVRALNPANYLSEAEAEAKEAAKLQKEADKETDEKEEVTE